ncbi:IS21-like element helper ATPase IstB [Croceicoccus sp. Ery5]|jgi:DNA replication protein DnaC|uniref:IS21-like element helper ATPase IstB n=1 Tax=Croceicoccus sp. Ery5 TaxID=1703340 RepID=UPI001E4DDD36|nr:IS21-like element helper ATPase IstB [Croceicoccus sp. Ery5]
MSMESVRETLRALRLEGMLASLDQQALSPAFGDMAFIDRLQHLLAGEHHERQVRSRQRLFRQAKFKHTAADPSRILFGGERALDKAQIAELIACEWIRNADNLLISGATGTGKTWLACSLGVAAINRGLSVRYVRTNPMLEEMRLAHLDGSLSKLRAALVRVSLLILDDFGIAPINEQAKEDLNELLDGRSNSGATMVAGQLEPSEWHAYLDSPHLADAILDRMSQRAWRLQLRGPSLRERK